jgi:hypothetical protein
VPSYVSRDTLTDSDASKCRRYTPADTDMSNEPKFTEAVAKKVYYGPVYFRRESEPYMTLLLAGTRRDAGVRPRARLAQALAARPRTSSAATCSPLTRRWCRSAGWCSWSCRSKRPNDV